MDILLLLSLPPLFVIFVFLYSITQHLLHKLQNLPPAPFLILPIFGHLYFFTKPATPFHRALSRVSPRHGPILFLRLGSRPTLLVSSPSAAQQCLTKNDIAFANRPDLLNGKHFGNNFTSIAWASYGDHWRNLRRISAHKLDALSSIRAEEARATVHKLVESCNGLSKGGVDMKTFFFEHAYRVVMGMIKGKATTEEDVEEAEVFMEIVEEMSVLTIEANVLDFLPFLGWLGFGQVERKMRFLQEKRENFMKNVIEKHHRIRRKKEFDGGNGNGGMQKNVIDDMLDLQTEEAEYYTDDMIKNLLVDFLQGASHTSATTLEYAFSHLLENQDTILARARAEIDTLVGKHRLLNDSDLSKLPYLQCIINETLRMHPAAPLLTPHVSSEECTVEGFRIPRGTMLVVNAWEIHHSQHIWKDPGEFVPERFEKGGLNGFEFLPFGWGRRACPGDRMAFQLVGLALGCLIQCFDLGEDC